MKQKTSVHKFKWPNGLTVLYRYTPTNPVSACHLFLTEGTGSEEATERGITTLLFSLLLKGTATKSAKQLAEELEGLGAHVGGGASHDNSHVSCHAASDYFLNVIGIMAEVLFHAAFPTSEFEKEKSALLAAIQSKKESIFTMANEELNANLYPGHPYAVPSSGTEISVNKLHHDMIFERHKKIVSPIGAILSLACNRPANKILPALKKYFGPTAWPKPKRAAKKMKPIGSIQTNIDIQRTDPFEQAFLMLGYSAAPLSSKDAVGLKILSTVLGGGMSSRLFQSLREQRGLAYDVGAFYPSKKMGSSFVFYMGLQMSKLDEAKKGIMDEIARIQNEMVPAQELSEVKSYFKGITILENQTNSQRAYLLGWNAFVGRPLTYEKDFLIEVDRITPAQLQKIAQKYLGKPFVTVEIHPKKKISPPSLKAS